MTNYEKYRESIDLTLQRGEDLAFNKNTKEATACQRLNCKDCLFFRSADGCYCAIKAMKWLVSEYKEPVEPEIDWSKVPVDTPVLVSDDGVNWERRYFVRKPAEAMFGVYSNGATSWSADGYVAWYRYAKLANEN